MWTKMRRYCILFCCIFFYVFQFFYILVQKLIAFGVTHVCAIDGFSGKIVGFISMPVKSNTIIYDKLYRYALGWCVCVWEEEEEEGCYEQGLILSSLFSLKQDAAIASLYIE